MISIHFQGKPFNISVIQVYAPTPDAKEAEVDQFYEDLEDLLEWNEEFQRIARRNWKDFNGQYKEIEENNRKGIQSLGHEDSLQEGMATLSVFLPGKFQGA